jgi:hypothetical protein
MSDHHDSDGRAPVAISLADALMFFAPGTVLLLSVLLFEYWCTHLNGFTASTYHTPLLTITRMVKGLFANGANWSMTLALLLPVGLGVYMTGHIVNAVSSLLIDRTLVYKAYGYPYERLFQIAEEKRKPKEGKPQEQAERRPETPDHKERTEPAISKSFWRGLFFWINTYLTLRWLEVFARSVPSLDHWSDPVNMAARSLGWGILILMIARQPFIWMRARRKGSGARDIPGYEYWLGRVFEQIAAGPYDLIGGKPLQRVLHTRASFDAVFREKYREFFHRRFGLDSMTAGSNNYWMTYMHVLENSPRLAVEINQWQRLYRFSRNASTAFYLGFIYCMAWFVYHRGTIGDWHASGMTRLAVLTYLLFIVSGILLVYFYYLYVCYYSKTIFRAFFYLETQKGETAPRG